MPDSATSAHPVLSSKYLPMAVIGLALSILGGTIAFATYDLRTKSREQITRQYAEVLYALWSSQAWSEPVDTQVGLSARPSDQLLSMLQTAQLPQLKGLRGNRLFDTNGVQILADIPLVDAPPQRPFN